MEARIHATIRQDTQEGSDLFLKMYTETMDNTVALGVGLEVASRYGTGESGWLDVDLGMFGAEMEIERLLLEKGLMARGTGVIGGVGSFEVLLHMVVHRVLALHNDSAGGALKTTVGCTMICQGGLAEGLCRCRCFRNIP